MSSNVFWELFTYPGHDKIIDGKLMRQYRVKDGELLRAIGYIIDYPPGYAEGQLICFEILMQVMKSYGITDLNQRYDKDSKHLLN